MARKGRGKVGWRGRGGIYKGGRKGKKRYREMETDQPPKPKKIHNAEMQDTKKSKDLYRRCWNERKNAEIGIGRSLGVLQKYEHLDAFSSFYMRWKRGVKVGAGVSRTGFAGLVWWSTAPMNYCW